MASPLSLLVSLQALVGIRVQPRFGSNSLRHPPAQCAAPRYVFDPLNLHSRPQPTSGTGLAAAALAGAAAPLLGGGRPAWAATDVNAAAIKDAISQAALDPATFQPVCPASDGLYRFSQKLVVAVVGGENYKEYAPLIAGGLLRVRLELCVVESFVYEAVLPFVKEKGLSWILPLHETAALALTLSLSLALAPSLEACGRAARGACARPPPGAAPRAAWWRRRHGCPRAPCR